jgi:hypothetical protein
MNSKNVPGFTPIFNGKDLTGWHVSKANHHGITASRRTITVQHGMIVPMPRPRRPPTFNSSSTVLAL